MKLYSKEEGEALVKTARNSIELYLQAPDFDRKLLERRLEGFESKQGVYVTINIYPTMELRGCIGFARSFGEIKSQIIEAAIASATQDMRFKPLSYLELEHVIIEVNILSEMVKLKINPATIKKEIKLGETGLFIEYGYYSGLVLPEVAIEKKLDKEKLLEYVCTMAGLAKDAWKRSDISLYKFTSQIFREKSPNGEVDEVKIG